MALVQTRRVASGNLAASAAAAAAAAAEVSRRRIDCPVGVVANRIFEGDLHVASGICEVSDVNVTGSVIVAAGAGLAITGSRSWVGSNIKAKGAVGRFELIGVEVAGYVRLTDSHVDVVVRGASIVGLPGLSLEGGSGSLLVVSSSMPLLEVTDFQGNTALSEASIAEELSLEGSGALEIRAGCTLDTVDVQRSGDVSVQGPMTTVTELELVESGNLIAKGPADIGYVKLQDSGSTTISEKVVALQVIAVDSAEVRITNASVAKVDVTSGSGAVILSNLMAEQEVVVTERGSGDIVLTAVTTPDLKVEGVLGPVTVQSSSVIDATFAKNVGGVVLSNSHFDTLECTENQPPPVTTGNTFKEPPTEQCAKQ